MYFTYSILLIILFILFLPVVVVALATTPKFRAGFFEKLGFYKSFNSIGKKNIIVHAVSVGEVIAVEKFVKTLRENFPDDNIILTTVTKTGNGVANNKLSKVVDKIVYFPFDFCFSVNSFIHNLKPDVVIIAETEIWPYFSKALKDKNIPILIINGRISPHSYNGYKKFSWFFKRILSNYTKILMQSEGDRRRIIDVGAPEDITKVMGNLKFDISNNLNEQNINDLKTEFRASNNPILMVGSTHKGEDEILLSVYNKLLKIIPNLKMILAPRHPERLKDVENLIVSMKFQYGKRSERGNFENNQIVLLDTMGELAKLYSISKIAFIGGSFSNTGGHNPLEAAIYNVPVVSGYSTFNFKDIYNYLTTDEAAFVVHDEEELFEIILKLLKEDDFYNKTAQNCNKVFEKNSGAITNAINNIKELF